AITPWQLAPVQTFTNRLRARSTGRRINLCSQSNFRQTANGGAVYMECAVAHYRVSAKQLHRSGLRSSGSSLFARAITFETDTHASARLAAFGDPTGENQQRPLRVLRGRG